jgi:hypothetical protein
MASNFSTVKLAAGLVNEARREAELLNRSLGGQIEHWARLGRAIENAPGFTLERVRDTLEGRLDAPALSVQEQDSLFEQLGDRFAAPSETVRARYAALGATTGAVGVAGGRIVERQASGDLKPRR